MVISRAGGIPFNVGSSLNANWFHLRRYAFMCSTTNVNGIAMAASQSVFSTADYGVIQSSLRICIWGEALAFWLDMLTFFSMFLSLTADGHLPIRLIAKQSIYGASKGGSS
jgi:hypothetical protein